ncbi:hypothetical protein HMPREF9057_00835 [Actinomyces sp. oral taxon 171 str. F0337]|nr:hypothetical protein HMPREF9057_00835 [Actinomyces sp. oral taxon 171 str. F0337]
MSCTTDVTTGMCGVPGVSRTWGDSLFMSRYGRRPCEQRSTQRNCWTQIKREAACGGPPQRR